MDAYFTAPAKIDRYRPEDVDALMVERQTPWHATCDQCSHYVDPPAWVSGSYAWCEECEDYTLSAEDPEAVGCGEFSPRWSTESPTSAHAVRGH